MQDFNRAWIGGNDRDVEGKFVWTDGTIVSDGFENWRDGDPSNTNGDMMKWNDLFYSTPHPSLCEFEHLID